MDTIQATPRNAMLGLLADALNSAYQYANKPGPAQGKYNPVLGLLADVLPIKAAANVLDDLSYGHAPIRGRGMTTQLTPDAKEVALALAPFPRASAGAALAGMGAVDTGVGKAMFIGPTAKTWDRAAAATAQKMEKAGADPRAIWSETGTFKGPDGKWRQEIDDSVSVPGHRLYSWGEAADLSAQNTVPVRRQKALLHPPLSAAYPDTKQIGVLLKPGSPNGAYVADTDWITVGAGKNGAADRSLMLHELQHAVQKREGFASGGAPSEFATGPMFDKRASDLASEFSQNINGSVSTKPQEIIQTLKYGEPEELKAIANRHGFATVDDAVTFLANEDARRTPLGQYRRLAGEAEARATQARMNMTPAERRATFPYDSYDVPVDQLIVRGLLEP